MAKNTKGNSEGTKDMTTEDENVSRASRPMPGAGASYRNPNSLDFSPEMIEYYKKEGFSLRWVACMDHKSRTFTNARINHFKAMGGHLVTPAEVKKVDKGFLSGLIKYDYREDFADEEEDGRGRNDSTGIRKDDLVVMAIPLAYKEYKARENRELVAEQLAAAEHKHTERGLDIVKNQHGSANVRVKGGFFSGK